MSDSEWFGVDTMTKQAAGEYLVSLRRLAGLNQAQVIHATGLSDRQLSRLENGHSVPTLVVLHKLMRALDGSMDRFADLLVSKKATLADAMRDAADGRSIKDLAQQIKSEEELEELIRAYRDQSGA